MIVWLAVRDFAIVQTLELAFEPGLTVLTGETGAGKSIVVDALALLLGSRADPTFIRPGCAAAELQAAFDLRNNHDASRWLGERELASDGECVLRRIIAEDKPSRAFINGRAVPIQSLRELGGHLADVHGQHEHQSLLRPAVQQQILDQYAGITDSTAALALLSRKLRAVRAELRDAVSRETDVGERIALARHELNELSAIGLEPGEYEQLDAGQKRLAHLNDLLRGTREALHRLYDGDENSVYAELSHCLQDLAALSEFDPRLADGAALLEEARVRVTEVCEHLRHAAVQYDADPEALERVQQRLGTVHDLARKHRVPPELLTDVEQQLRAELDRLEMAGSNRERLEQAADRLCREWDELAGQVSSARHEAAGRLAQAVTREIRDLGMPDGEFRVTLTLAGDEQRLATGRESVALEVTTNPGHPPRPLARVASGGELSRISLAIQVVVADLGQASCLIFDEVDVGVGGRTAAVVGRRLRALGASRQILCITHLPQVACRGRHHLRVQKAHDTGTHVTVAALDEDDRVNEIARMLGGARITERSIAHARELLSDPP